MKQYPDAVCSSVCTLRHNGIIGSDKKLIGMVCFNFWLDIPFSEVIKSFALPNYLNTAALPIRARMDRSSSSSASMRKPSCAKPK